MIRTICRDERFRYGYIPRPLSVLLQTKSVRHGPGGLRLTFLFVMISDRRTGELLCRILLTAEQNPVEAAIGFHDALRILMPACRRDFLRLLMEALSRQILP